MNTEARFLRPFVPRVPAVPTAARPALVALLVVAPIAFGRLGALSEYHALMLGFGCVYAIAALSVNLLTGYAGQISLGHAAFLGVGAYASGWVTWTHERPFLLGLLLAVGLGALSALIVGFPALRIRGLNLALLTLGFGLAMSAMVFRLRAVTGSAAGLTLPRPNINGYILNDNREFLSVLVALLVVFLWLDRNLVRSKLGRALRALREDEDVAASFGVDVARTKLLAFVLSGAVAGAAGAGLGHLIGIAQVETFSLDLSMTLVIIVALGGFGSAAGAVVMGVLFGILPRVLHFMNGWELIVGPALVALSLARNPGGMAQHVREIRERRSHRPSPEHGEAQGEIDVRFGFAEGAAAAPRITLASDIAPLVVHDLRVSFGGLRAVDDFSFRAQPGRITGIVGPNGAGKSTVFNAISGFVPMQSGRVFVGGVDVSTAPPHERVAAGLGRTFQLVGLIKQMTVLENLLLAQQLRVTYDDVSALIRLPRVRQEELRLGEAAEAAIDALGFGRHLHSRLGVLSHGQQRIVEIACALANGPLVLMLDEPTAGLSPAASESLAGHLLELRDQLGQTVVLIEHHIPFVTATCSEVVVMASGARLAEGEPQDVFGDSRVVAAYLGEAS